MNTTFKFEKSKQKSLKDFAYESIKEAIIKGVLPPGSRLRETEIASQMGISRGPIREALSLLSQEGLVYSHPYRETVVAEISPAETEKIYVPIRKVIENYVAENAHRVLGEKEYNYLDLLLDKMESACKKDDLDTLTEHDIEFHSYLVKSVASPNLYALWNNIIAKIHARLLYQGIKHIDLDSVTLEHREYLQYIKENNFKKVREHLETHIY
ncbi:GntR family transcriptional regulator [Petroclostridium sp. X23]|uniref:GntR family transcriptional regulator n=1 Tax=Petroclostridium sp. X23 TaxID=3045146 RepID=UPI0024AE73DC|nr:GntR family transcriptional regulator [Petroclostridium sp. X23]WHH57679.1 GntR family transcriptional regulator [Petroclostridium sp. X23]